MNPEIWIPILTTAVIAIATLAVIPIIRALSELKQQAKEIHDVVNSNFSKQTTELKVANGKIEDLVKTLAESNARFSELLVVLHNKMPAEEVAIPVTVVNPDPVKVDVIKADKK